MCGNGICEVGERTVEGLVDGTCAQDCSFETKVRAGWGWLVASSLHNRLHQAGLGAWKFERHVL